MVDGGTLEEKWLFVDNREEVLDSATAVTGTKVRLDRCGVDAVTLKLAEPVVTALEEKECVEEERVCTDDNSSGRDEAELEDKCCSGEVTQELRGTEEVGRWMVLDGDTRDVEWLFVEEMEDGDPRDDAEDIVLIWEVTADVPLDGVDVSVLL